MAVIVSTHSIRATAYNLAALSVQGGTLGLYNAGELLSQPPGLSTLNDANNIAALALLTTEVIERVRSSCLHLSEAELGALAKSMATLELKYLGYASATLCERRVIRVVD